MTLREAVLAWVSAETTSKTVFETARGQIIAELDAVGGYATTSPDPAGYCRTFHRTDETWAGGVAKVGEDAPKCPSVGDRCHEHDMTYRALAFASADARKKVETITAALITTPLPNVHPEALAYAARALVLENSQVLSNEEKRRCIACGAMHDPAEIDPCHMKHFKIAAENFEREKAAKNKALDELRNMKEYAANLEAAVDETR